MVRGKQGGGRKEWAIIKDKREEIIVSIRDNRKEKLNNGKRARGRRKESIVNIKRARGEEEGKNGQW